MRALILCLLLAGCGDGGGLLEPTEKPTHEAAPVPTKPERNDGWSAAPT